MVNTPTYFHFSILRNSIKNHNPQDDLSVVPQLLGEKEFKIRVRKKLIYIVEIKYYSTLALLKFHPKIYETDSDRYKMVGIGLTYSEKRRLLNTCCKIVYSELEKSDGGKFYYGFFGQCYEKDDYKSRSFSKRFDWYIKQVTTFFSSKNYNHQKIDKINFYCISKKENSEFMSQKLINFLEGEKLITKLMTAKTRKEYWIANGYSESEIVSLNLEFENS